MLSKRVLLVACTVAAMWSLATVQSQAHPISLSSTIVDVREDRVLASVEVMLEDLVLYHALVADANHRYDQSSLNEAAEAHATFVTKYFQIRDAEGNRVSPKVTRIDKSVISAAGAAQSELMSKTVTYDLVFALPSPPPFLTVTQIFGGPQAALPAVMDLMLLQNEILIRKPVQLTHGQPYTVKLDWLNPPTKESKGFAALRKQRESRRREQLGIASYGGLYSYIYIAPREVRHEILIPLLSFEKWLPIARADRDFLEVQEQQAAKAEIEAFFGKGNPVKINGHLVVPELTRLNFFTLDINDFAANAEPRRVGVHQARLGLILSYRADQVVKELDLRWETFHQFAPFMRSIVLVGDEDPSEHYFRPQTPSFHWERDPASRPPFTPRAVKGVTADVDESRLKSIVAQVLRNIYGSFELSNDSQVYDSLATSVTGELLHPLYLDVKRSLVMAEQGGAVSRVKKIDVVAASRTGKASRKEVRCRCIWQVEGTVEHWGHVHTRVNQYGATMTIQCDREVYRLSGLEIDNVQRVRFQTTIRGM